MPRRFVSVALFVAVLSLAGCGTDVSTSVTDGQDTNVEEADFSLSLPGSWTELAQQDPNLWQYMRADQNLQLSVSVYNDLADDATVEMYMKARMQAEREAAPATALTDPVYEDRDGLRIAHYAGSDSTDGRQVASDVCQKGSVLVQLYLEGYVSEQETSEVLAAITASLGFRP